MIDEINIPVIKDYIKNSSKQSAVYVGCDSHKSSGRKKTTVFYTVVVVHKEQCHGGKVFAQKTVLPSFTNNRDRLLKEVELAVTLGYELIDCVEDRPFEIHLDLNPNPNHFSSTVVKEAIGWVKGMGMEPVIKPDSWAANAAADRFAVKATAKRR